jgi:hypothetical protein
MISAQSILPASETSRGMSVLGSYRQDVIPVLVQGVIYLFAAVEGHFSFRRDATGDQGDGFLFHNNFPFAIWQLKTGMQRMWWSRDALMPRSASGPLNDDCYEENGGDRRPLCGQPLRQAHLPIQQMSLGRVELVDSDEVFF